MPPPARSAEAKIFFKIQEVKESKEYSNNYSNNYSSNIQIITVLICTLHLKIVDSILHLQHHFQASKNQKNLRLTAG